MSATPRGTAPRPRPALFALLWLALALVWFLPLGTPSLLNPDEGRYAEIPREMVASGDWVTPRLDGLKYFEKPPLQYWASAVAYEVAGEHAWTARLWTALCGFLGLALTFRVGRRLYGERAAYFSVLVQASALLYVGLARVDTLDMGLCFTLQLAMSALALLVQDAPEPPEPPEPPRRPDAPARPDTPDPPAGPSGSLRLPLLLALGVSLATLSKGLVGILIPAAAAVLYMLIYREARLLLVSRPWWTALLLCLLAAPWFVLVSLRNPEFAHFFFVFEHFQRYLNPGEFRRYQPVWFFVPVLALGLIPWLTLLPRTLLESVRAARHERATGLLLIWAMFVFLFFSASQSKLATYILPMMPALALLMGRTLAALPAARLATHLRIVAATFALVAAAGLVLTQWPRAAGLIAGASTASVALFIGALALLAAGAALGAHCCRLGRPLLGAASAALGALLLTEAVLLGLAQLPRARAEQALSRQLAPLMSQYRHFYCVNLYVQTVPFYLRRTCTLVSYRGELDFGLRREPSRGIGTLGEFAAVWQREGSALAILRPADYRSLQSLGTPMRVIYTAASLVAVARQ
jgi:4-amino-4-deoxy-L-arabinose transferase-like glycosyltransferase